MGLNVKLYNIISDGSYSVRYKSGDYPYPETIDSTFTFYGSGLTDASITISGLTFDTQYWIKMTDETTGRYIIKNIYSHDSKAFPCYDTICFDVETLCLSPTPSPSITPTPTSSTIIVSPTPTPTNTPTPTPTPTTVPQPLVLTWNNISNANILVGDATNVSNWNTYFQLPTNGTPFTSVSVVGNIVNLFGGNNINLRDNLFSPGFVGNKNILSVVDTASCITTAGIYCFNDCTSVTTFNLPSLTTAGEGCFYFCSSSTTFNLPSLTTVGNFCFRNCTSATTFNLPSCTNLGGTVGNNSVFLNITGNTITLTIPSVLMTCNSGNPDGDIQYLQANNTVTVIITPTSTPTSTPTPTKTPTNTPSPTPTPSISYKTWTIQECTSPCISPQCGCAGQTSTTVYTAPNFTDITDPSTVICLNTTLTLAFTGFFSLGGEIYDVSTGSPIQYCTVGADPC